MLPFQRPDYRKEEELRHISIETGFAPYAHGSALISFDNTKVICSAILENKVPRWMIQQGVEGGWISAEYSMLPYSTLDRKQRDITRGKLDGRTVEIQRMIGRALRAVVNLKKLSGFTLWIDCDVIRADGGTRTAAINGAYVAARLAVQKAMIDGKLKEDPFTGVVSAISVGVYQDVPVLDLNYVEDKNATVDFNVVMTDSGEFIEIQGAGEGATFPEEQLHSLLSLAKKGISKISHLQLDAIKNNSKLKSN